MAHPIRPWLATVFTLGAFLFVPHIVTAAEPVIVDLWPARPPGFQVTTGEEKDTSDENSRRVADQHVIRLGNVSKPQLHFYPAPPEKASGTTVVICPGGGFNILAWNLEGTEVAEWLNSIGVSAAVLKYRTPTRQADVDWLPPTQDAQRAVRWLRANSEKLGIHPERIGIAGFSAGGRTAAMTAVNGGKPLYDPVDEIDQHSPRVNFQILIYTAYLVDDAGVLKPDVRVDQSSPPAFLVHAQNDSVTPKSSTALFLALTDANVPAELHIFPEGGHGYGLRKTEQPITHWPLLCEDWLKGQGLLSKADAVPK